jgi:hypothetical protein
MLRVGNKKFSFTTIIMFLLILPPETYTNRSPSWPSSYATGLDPEVLQPIAADLEHWTRRVCTIVSAACQSVCPTHLINLCSRALQWQPQIRWQQRCLAAGLAAQLTNSTPAHFTRGLAVEVTKLCVQCLYWV